MSDYPNAPRGYLEHGGYNYSEPPGAREEPRAEPMDLMRRYMEMGYDADTARALATMTASGDRRMAARQALDDSTRRGSGGLQYIDDIIRVAGNEASFGVGDHVEGLANSLIHDVNANDSLQSSRERTGAAQENLGPIVGTGAQLAGGLAGYLSLLPRLPVWAAGKATSMFTPAALPLEGIRGFMNSEGPPNARVGAAMRHLAANPYTMFNPRTGGGMAASMFPEPVMAGAGFGRVTPSGYLSELLDAAGVD